MQLIDGYNGGVAHISASMIRDHNLSLYGDSDCVLPVGNKFSYEVVNNNTIRISDGMAIIGGARATIEYGQTETAIIENGVSGYKRNDIIVIEYSKDNETLIESAAVKVVKGSIGSSGVDPTLVTGNVRAGATVKQMALYRVRINGLSIEGVDTLWKPAPKFIEGIEYGTTNGWDYIKYENGNFCAWKYGNGSYTCTNASGSMFYSGVSAWNLPFNVIDGVANVSLGQQCFASNVNVKQSTIEFRAIRGLSGTLKNVETHIVVYGTC